MADEAPSCCRICTANDEDGLVEQMAEASTSPRSDTQASPSISFATYMQMVLGMESKMAVAKKGTARKNRTAGGKSSSSQIDLFSNEPT